ncbi:MAG: LysM peptidoglycan-binding domain-containing protein [Elusimicrobiales bacterium]
MIKLIFVFLIFETAGHVYSESNIEKYKVKKGDYLYKIAFKYYKDPSKWNIIYGANSDKIKNPDFIYEGMVLDIPIDKSETKSEDYLAHKFPQISSNNLTDYNEDMKKNENLIEDKSENQAPDFNRINYKLKKKEVLSEDFPHSMVSFNISQDRIEVNKDFFDGEVITDGSKKLFTKGDMVKLNFKDFKTDFKKALIYNTVEEKEDTIVADKAGECEILKGEGNKCLIIKNTMPIENKMKIKLWN